MITHALIKLFYINNSKVIINNNKLKDLYLGIIRKILKIISYSAL